MKVKPCFHDVKHSLQSVFRHPKSYFLKKKPRISKVEELTKLTGNTKKSLCSFFKRTRKDSINESPSDFLPLTTSNLEKHNRNIALKEKKEDGPDTRFVQKLSAPTLCQDSAAASDISETVDYSEQCRQSDYIGAVSLYAESTKNMTATKKESAPISEKKAMKKMYDLMSVANQEDQSQDIESIVKNLEAKQSLYDLMAGQNHSLEAGVEAMIEKLLTGHTPSELREEAQLDRIVQDVLNIQFIPKKSSDDTAQLGTPQEPNHPPVLSLSDNSTDTAPTAPLTPDSTAGSLRHKPLR